MVSNLAGAPYVGKDETLAEDRVSELDWQRFWKDLDKPTMALMVDNANNYVGVAFMTNRRIKERLLARVQSKAAAEGHVEET